MEIVVQKYGGSSIADVERVGRVAERIARTRAEGKSVVVVVSAMGDTTDELLALAHRVCESPARRELDMLLTAGERISMALVSMALNARGVPAVSFTGSQSGIITTDTHNNARIVEVRPARVQQALERGEVVIVAGYQGVSSAREVTTLGRGGSDTTAVALAAALGASVCEIYSDVDGVYSADPRLVADARHLPEVTYEQMQELAGAGARVLNAQAVEFARRSGITIAARAADGSGRETLVRAKAASAGVAVASERSVVALETRAELDTLETLLGRCHAARLEPKRVSFAPGRAFVLFSQDSLPDLGALRACCIEDVELREGLGTVSAIGGGLGIDALRVLLDACRGEDAPVLAIDVASLRRTIVTADPFVDRIAQSLHRALARSPASPQ